MSKMSDYWAKEIREATEDENAREILRRRVNSILNLKKRNKVSPAKSGANCENAFSHNNATLYSSVETYKSGPRKGWPKNSFSIAQIEMLLNPPAPVVESAPSTEVVTTAPTVAAPSGDLTPFQQAVNADPAKYGVGFGKRKGRLAPLTREQYQARQALYAELNG